jgi:hypothetical protein
MKGGLRCANFCDRFGLNRYEYKTVSGFLRRLENGPFREFPYTVIQDRKD